MNSKPLRFPFPGTDKPIVNQGFDYFWIVQSGDLPVGGRYLIETKRAYKTKIAAIKCWNKVVEKALENS